MRDGGVYADVTAQRVTLGNSLAERSWNRAALTTLELRDKRGRDHVWSRNTPDFRLFGTGAPITSEQFAVTECRSSTWRAEGSGSRCSSRGRPG